MAKTHKTKKPNTRGKGKVTPVQVAVIVERYLQDNTYASALTAFRSEAAAVLSKIKCQESPKGLLKLEDILDEYIKLKEDKLMIDQEKRRIEVAFQGLQEVMTKFNMPQSPSTLSTNPSSCSPSQGQMVNGSFINGAQQPAPYQKLELRSYSFQVPICSSGEKRKATTSTSNPLPKKHQPKSLKSPPIQSSISNSQVNVAKTIIQPSSKQKDSSSPKTPKETPEALISQTTIISPVKGKSTNFSVERSYQTSSASPLKKLTPYKSNKRELIKGRLDFDKLCDNLAVENSISGNDTEEAAAKFDFELPDFSLFDDFSKLLGGIELDCEQTQSHDLCERNLNAEVIPLKVMGAECQDATTTMRSITKRITISSPCKSGRVTLKQVNSPGVS